MHVSLTHLVAATLFQISEEMLLCLLEAFAALFRTKKHEWTAKMLIIGRGTRRNASFPLVAVLFEQI